MVPQTGKSKQQIRAEAKLKRDVANILEKEVTRSKSAVKKWIEDGEQGEAGKMAYFGLVMTEELKIKKLEAIIQNLRDEAGALDNQAKKE